MEYKKRFSIFLTSLIITLVLTRISLYFFPLANFNVGSYNIHHFFTGALILLGTSLFYLFDKINLYTLILGGIGAAWVVDELVYLLFTNGTDQVYFTQTSFLGALGMSACVIVLVSILYFTKKNEKMGIK